MRGDVLDRPSAPEIDARLRARRIEVRRNEGRRRLRRLLVALVVTGLAVAAWAATRSPLLDVDHIEVSGAERTTIESVVAATGIRTGDALIDVDLGAAQRAVTGLPWVQEAELIRSWRGRVEVVVVERRPAVVVRDVDGSGWWVDAEGWVLAAADPAGPAPGSLPVIEGVEPSAVGERLDPHPTEVLSLAVSLPPPVRDLADAIVRDPEGEVWVRLRARPGETAVDGSPRPHGGRVRFGDARALDAQIGAAATVLTSVELADLDVLDVRVPSNPVVTRVDRDAEGDTSADGVGGE